MNLIWGFSNGIMCFFFGLASYVQHNDEFAAFWITVYAFPCFVTLLIALDNRIIFNQHFHRFIYFALFFYTLFSIYLFVCAIQVLGTNDDQYNFLTYQEGKELFGVLIIDGWLLLVIYFLDARIPFDALMTRSAKVIILCLSLSPLALWLYHGCFGREDSYRPQKQQLITNGNNWTKIATNESQYLR